jgi:parvulin-like peptidyl-prolyl isomerase
MARKRGQKIVSRKQRARAERERLMRLYIYIGTGVVLALVVGLIGFGVLQQLVIQPGQPVATVAGEEIRTDEFQSRVRYERRQLVNQYLNTLQTMEFFGDDEATQSFFLNNLQQIQLQLTNASLLGRDILNTMIDNEIIRQEAARRNITVSDEEVDQAIQDAFGFFPAGTPTPGAQSTPLPTSTLSPTQLSLVTATPTLTQTLTPVATPTLDPEASPTPTSEPLPTATPYTREAFETNFNQFLETLDQDIGFEASEFRTLFENQLYREKVQEAVTEDVSREREEVWARHILVEDEETAQEVLGRLDEGEDWTSLAAEFSTDTSNKDRGGDLGWFPRGRMAQEFENTAFDLEIGEISNPVETEFGWHIIQVLGHEMRTLSETQYQQAQQQAFEDWLAQKRLDSEVEILDYWSERVPDDPSLPPQLAGGQLPIPQAQPTQ